MNFRFKVVLDADGEGDYATLYSFVVNDNDIDELSRFLTDETYKACPDFPILVDRIDRMLDERGLNHPQSDFGRDRWFRDEGDQVSALWAPIPDEDKKHLKEPYPALRLYCFRIENILVAGSGGVKTTRRPTDDPVLREALRKVKHVRKRLFERIEDGTVQIIEDGFLLDGDLKFEPEIL